AGTQPLCFLSFSAGCTWPPNAPNMFGSQYAPTPESQVRAIPSGENFCMSPTSRFSTSASQAACNGRRSGKPTNSLASAGRAIDVDRDFHCLILPVLDGVPSLRERLRLVQAPLYRSFRPISLCQISQRSKHSKRPTRFNRISPYGTKLTCGDVRLKSGFKGNSSSTCIAQSVNRSFGARAKVSRNYS